jgi:hypothetical protein
MPVLRFGWYDHYCIIYETVNNVPWRTTLGPAWVGNVPDWVTETAKNYRHRGLPLVDLWQSSHCMVALGLSNHGVPGVYFSQKLP